MKSNLFGLSPIKELVDSLSIETLAIMNAIAGICIDHFEQKSLKPISFFLTKETKIALELLAKKVFYEPNILKNGYLTLDWTSDYEDKINSLIELKQVSDERLIRENVDVSFYRTKIKTSDDTAISKGKLDLMPLFHKGKKRFTLLEFLTKSSKNKGQDWNVDEIAEKIDGSEYIVDKKYKNRFYQTCDAINKQIGKHTGHHDFLLFDTNHAQINPIYTDLIS